MIHPTGRFARTVPAPAAPMRQTEEIRQRVPRRYAHRTRNPRGERLARKTPNPRGTRFTHRTPNPRGTRFAHRTPNPHGARLVRRTPNPREARLVRRTPNPREGCKPPAAHPLREPLRRSPFCALPHIRRRHSLARQRPVIRRCQRTPESPRSGTSCLPLWLRRRSFCPFSC